jgi:hypothetical protein
MNKRRKPAKMSRASKHAGLGAGACVALLLSTLCGCQGSPKTHSGDPLFGEYYPKGANGQPMPPPVPPAQKTSAVGVPPYPAANSAGSTAAIAANTDAAGLPGGRNLAINEKSAPTWTLTNNNGTGATASAPGTRTPVVQPIPRDTAAPAVTPVPTEASKPVATAPATPAKVPAVEPPSGGNPPIVASSTNGPSPAGTILKTGSWSSNGESLVKPATTVPGDATVDSLQKSLEAKGAFGIAKETVPEGVRVSCYAPPRSGTSNVRYLETVAPDPAAGLAALLQQLDR